MTCLLPTLRALHRASILWGGFRTRRILENIVHHWYMLPSGSTKPIAPIQYYDKRSSRALFSSGDAWLVGMADRSSSKHGEATTTTGPPTLLFVSNLSQNHPQPRLLFHPCIPSVQLPQRRSAAAQWWEVDDNHVTIKVLIYAEFRRPGAFSHIYQYVNVS